jgi:hypothetical protein
LQWCLYAEYALVTGWCWSLGVYWWRVGGKRLQQGYDKIAWSLSSTSNRTTGLQWPLLGILD